MGRVTAPGVAGTVPRVTAPPLHPALPLRRAAAEPHSNCLKPLHFPPPPPLRKALFGEKPRNMVLYSGFENAPAFTVPPHLPFNFIRLSLHKYQPAELWIHWDLYPGSPVRFNAFWMSIQPYASPGDKIRVRALSEDWQTTISQNYFQEKNVCKTSLGRKNKNHIRSCFPKIWQVSQKFLIDIYIHV